MNYIYKDELYHHGIKGQRWGIRRYQNFDGSYTQAGLKRYYNSEKNYQTAKEHYRTTKSNYKQGSATKYDVNVAKSDYKMAKQRMNKDYRHLKQDKLGDQGKNLYAQGRRITDNAAVTKAIVTGTSIATTLLYRFGKEKEAMYTFAAGTAIGIGKSIVDEYQNRRLRAFYAHTSNY